MRLPFCWHEEGRSRLCRRNILAKGLDLVDVMLSNSHVEDHSSTVSLSPLYDPSSDLQQKVAVVSFVNTIHVVHHAFSCPPFHTIKGRMAKDNDEHYIDIRTTAE